MVILNNLSLYFLEHNMQSADSLSNFIHELQNIWISVHTQTEDSEKRLTFL